MGVRVGQCACEFAFGLVQNINVHFCIDRELINAGIFTTDYQRAVPSCKIKRWALIRNTRHSFPSLYAGGRGRGGTRTMPPKKKEVEGPGPLLGRFGTSLKCGIVGLPNVG